MNKTNKVLSVLLVLFLLGTAGIAVLLSTYHIIDSHLYPKSATELELQRRSVSTAHFEQLCKTMRDALLMYYML